MNDENAKQRDFTAVTGPLFIVGLSRSGTKLLRELLNQHPRVRILQHESHFIPAMVEVLNTRHPTITESARLDYIRRLKRTAFYKTMQRSGQMLSDGALLALSDRRTWPEVIEATLRQYLGAQEQQFVWGDKSPSYLLSMSRLLSYYPGARFVHIVRDPRDRAASAQEAWAAHPLISSQQWLKGIHYAAQFADTHPHHYYALHYEELLEDSERTMRGLVQFLGIDFVSEMCALEHPVENRGALDKATRTRSALYTGSIGRHRADWSITQIQRMEEIVFPIAATHGYTPGMSARAHKPLRRREWLRCSPGHYLRALGPLVRRWGLLNGIRLAWQRARPWRWRY